jgi:hypothetical protein
MCAQDFGHYKDYVAGIAVYCCRRCHGLEAHAIPPPIKVTINKLMDAVKVIHGPAENEGDALVDFFKGSK